MRELFQFPCCSYFYKFCFVFYSFNYLGLWISEFFFPLQDLSKEFASSESARKVYFSCVNDGFCIYNDENLHLIVCSILVFPDGKD